MRKLLIISILALLSNTSSAQWTEIANFQGTDGTVTIPEVITVVYFLDLSGPARIGFVGTYSELHKTTDGGLTWHSVWDNGKSYDGYYVTDICFKDSLTGWFSVYNEYGSTGDACYRTTDGGESWKELPVPNVIGGGYALYYNNSNNRLLLSELDTGLEVSTDLGNTWKVISPIDVGGFSFSNDSMGIATGATDSNIGIIRTTDGGLTWSLLDTIGNCGNHPLAIPGTPICFEADRLQFLIRRSDDYGQTWNVIKDFGAAYYGSNDSQIAPSANGVIRGDLSRLCVSTNDSGMYVSTDQGITWKNDGGPSTGGQFYSGKGITIAGEEASGQVFEGAGLWEEIWPTAGVAENTNSESSCFYAVGPYPDPSAMSGDNVSILVHYCVPSMTITAQVYNMLGGPIGSPVTYTSDGQIWDRLEIPAPGTAGSYYIQVSVGAFGATLSYSVY